MATVYKVLGQANPSATTNTVLYSPTGVPAIISSIVICNQAASTATYRIIIQQSADVSATILTKQYIAYDVVIAANDSTALTLGITLASGDSVKVYASAATMSFMAFGSELQDGNKTLFYLNYS